MCHPDPRPSRFGLGRDAGTGGKAGRVGALLKWGCPAPAGLPSAGRPIESISWHILVPSAEVREVVREVSRQLNVQYAYMSNVS